MPGCDGGRIWPNGNGARCGRITPPAGDAWNYFPYEHARSRAYRWGEDGIAGFTDDRLRWCLSLALWNGRDPILKERLFGLTNAQGNHGEDVKELYYYLDGTPTHSYMRMLYKYPQAAFPYDDLIAENARRGLDEPEYELLDTGVFDDGRYFDVTVEYAKATPDDILMRITIDNRGPEAADTACAAAALGAQHLGLAAGHPGAEADAVATAAWTAWHNRMPQRRLDIDAKASWLFCRNETNTRRLYGSDATGPFKDGINDYRGQRADRCGRPAARHEMRRACGADAAAGRSGRCCGCAGGRRPRRAIRSPIMTRCSPRGWRRRTRSMPPCRRTSTIPTPGWCSARRWPACCGRSSSIVTTCAAGWKATRCSRRRRRSA